MEQHEIIVDVVERQLLTQARLTLAQRTGPPSKGRDMLAQAEVEAFHQRGVDVPAQRAQNLIDGLDRAEDHTVHDVDSSLTPRGLDHLRIEQLRQGDPARLGQRPCGLTPRRLHPVPRGGEQGRRVLSQSIGHKERRTIGRQYLSDVVDEALGQVLM